MNNRLIITFEKSQEDIPVLIVGMENHMAYITGGPSLTISICLLEIKQLKYGTHWKIREERRSNYVKRY